MSNKEYTYNYAGVPVPDTIVERLKKEQSDLNDKILKLEKFIDSPTDEYFNLSDWHQLALKQQLKAMNEYYSILELRIGDLKDNG